MDKNRILAIGFGVFAVATIFANPGRWLSESSRPVVESYSFVENDRAPASIPSAQTFKAPAIASKFKPVLTHTIDPEGLLTRTFTPSNDISMPQEFPQSSPPSSENFNPPSFGGYSNEGKTNSPAKEETRKPASNDSADTVSPSVPGNVGFPTPNPSTGSTSGSSTNHSAATGSAASAPANLTAEGAPSLITLTWQASVSDTSVTYSVERSLSPTSGFAVIASGLSTPSYADSSAANGTVYYYRVASINAIGGTYSVTISAMASIVPSTPTLIVAASNGSASLSWPASSGAGPITYSVERSLTPTTGFGVITSGLSTTVHSDLSVANGTLYYYRVQAHNAGGDSNYSAEVQSKSINAFLLGTATAGNQQVTLTWNAATGAASYDVKYGTATNTYTTTLTNKTSPFVITGLTAGTPYYFSVTAKNTFNGVTVSTNELIATPLGAFTITSITPTDIGKLRLVWGASTGAITYDISCGTSTGNYSYITVFNVSSPATISGLANATQYFCMVTAKNASGGSADATAEASATTFSLLTHLWPFDAGTESTYSFDASKLELVDGVSRLKNMTPTDASYLGDDFKTALFFGTKWDSVSASVTLDATTDDGELNSQWTPKYDKITGYWKLNGTDGASIAAGDVIRATRGKDGVAQNPDGLNFKYSSGQQKQAMMFGGDDFVKVSDSTALNPANGDFSIQMWLKSDSQAASSNVLLSKFDGGLDFYWLGLSSGHPVIELACNYGTGSFATAYATASSILINDGRYHHIFATRVGSALSIYVDSVLAGSSTSTCNSNPTAPLQIGNRNDFGTSGDANIDEVAIWKAGLSAAEVKTVYERQRSRYTGTILSRVMDSGATTSWSGLQYLTQLPYGKELNGTIDEVSADYSHAPPSATGSVLNNMVGYWHLDETSGTTAKDSSTAGNHGTITGTPTLGTTGKYQTSMQFNGTSDYVQVPYSTSIDVTGTGISAGGWVYLNTYPTVATIDGSIISKAHSYYLTVQTTGKPAVYLYNTTVAVYQVANTSIPLNTWTHVAFTFDGSNTRIYINGELDYTNACSGSVPSSVEHLGIGAVGSVAGVEPNRRLNGRIDEVGLWSRTLSSTEIKTFYEAYRSINAGLVGLWHLNEGSSATTVADSSGQSLTGTVSNAALGGVGKLNSSAKFNGINSYINVGNHIDATENMTMSAWVKPDSATGNKEIFSKENGTTGYMLRLDGLRAIAGFFDGSYTPTAIATTDLPLGQWSHIAATRNAASGKVSIYVNGVLENQTAAGSAPLASTANLNIGRWPGGMNYFNGSLDEVAIWDRSLDSTEIAQLYQRGANRISIQARSCSSATCSDDPIDANWMGSNGSNSYFTELNNAAAGAQKSTTPNFLFTDFGFSLANQPYFQYRALLESDSSVFSPQLTSVSAGPARFDASTPTIVPINGPKYQIYTGFTTTLGASCSGTPKFQLSHDKQVWYYYSAGMWNTTTAGVTQASDSATINSNISSFGTVAGTGALYAKIFFPSNTSTACEIDKIEVAGADTATSVSNNPGAFRITSVDSGNGFVTLNWSTALGATSYKICYGTSQALANACATYVTTTGHAFPVTSLTNDTPYYFNVVALNASGATTTTTPAAATPMLPPSTPASLTAIAGLYHNQLSWSTSSGSGHISYSVKRSASPGGPYSTILATGVKTTAYTDLTALANTPYYYVITAVNESGPSSNSNEASAIPLGTFSIASIVGTNGVATLTWGAALGATAYDIQYGSSSGEYSTTVSNQTSGASVASLTNGTTYYFSVVAKNASGSALNSSEAIVIPVRGYTLIPGSPNIATLSIDVSNADTGATSSKLEYGTTAGTYTTTINSPTYPVSIGPLTVGTTYYFRATSWNAANGTYTTAEVNIKPWQEFNQAWKFTEGTESSYVQTAYVTLQKGLATLYNLIPFDDDDQAVSLNGIIWNSSAKSYELNPSTSRGFLTDSWNTSRLSSIVGYWALNDSIHEIAGGDALVATAGASGSFSNTNGTGLAYIGGKQGTGVYFDGVDDAAKIPDNGWTPGTNDFTLSYWIKLPMPTSIIRPFSKRPVCTHSSFFSTQVHTNGFVELEIDQDASATNYSGNYSNSSIADDQWHLVTFVRQTTDVFIYIDGALDAHHTHTGITNITNTGDFDVGNLSGCGMIAQSPFTIDDIAIYNTALTKNDVQEVYERQSAHYTGTLLSRIMDAGSAIDWYGINWFTRLPYGKELPEANHGDFRGDYSDLSPVKTGLVAHWKFDEENIGTASGGRKQFIDSSGNGNSLVENEASTLEPKVQGKYNLGVKSIGAKLKATLPAGTFSSNIASVSFWMFWDGTNSVMPVGFDQYDLWLNGGRLGYNTGNSDQYGVTVSNMLNQWVHVTAEFHANDVTLNKIYINGALQTLTYAGNTQAASNALLPDTLNIGGWDHSALLDSYRFKGRLDDVYVYNRRLTPEEVILLRDNESPIMMGNVGYWRFNDAPSTTGSNSVRNSQKQSNDGTPTSITFGVPGKFAGAAKFTSSSKMSVPATNFPSGASPFSFSFWLNTIQSSANNHPQIFSYGTATYQQGFFLTLCPDFDTNCNPGGATGGGGGLMMGPYGTGIGTNAKVNDGTWHHVISTFDGTTYRFYVDGVAAGSGAMVTNIMHASDPTFGNNSSFYGVNTIGYEGLLDEFGIWNRVLTSEEISQLYRRGANRVKMQVRTCSTANCSDDTIGANWRGHDGGGTNYLSEIDNTETRSPHIKYADTPTNSLATNRYFQYRAILQSDNSSTTPDLGRVEAGAPRFVSTNNSIYTVNGSSFFTLFTFKVMLGDNGCSGVPHYQFSTNKSTWYYHNGSAWVTGSNSYAQASTEAVASSNITTLANATGAGTLYVKAYLPTDGVTTCEIDEIVVTGAQY